MKKKYSHEHLDLLLKILCFYLEDSIPISKKNIYETYVKNSSPYDYVVRNNPTESIDAKVLFSKANKKIIEIHEKISNWEFVYFSRLINYLVDDGFVYVNDKEFVTIKTEGIIFINSGGYKKKQINNRINNFSKWLGIIGGGWFLIEKIIKFLFQIK